VGTAGGHCGWALRVGAGGGLEVGGGRAARRPRSPAGPNPNPNPNPNSRQAKDTAGNEHAEQQQAKAEAQQLLRQVGLEHTQSVIRRHQA
jgi:hypothetical protein